MFNFIKKLLQKEWSANEKAGHPANQSTTDTKPISVTMAQIDAMDGRAFEFFCADLLCHRGFVKVSVTQRSGDQGVDVLAEKDGVKYAIQCKNHATPLDNTPIQEVYAGKEFYKCHIGVVMTNRVFSLGAQRLADTTGVLLWDRAHLQRMLGESCLEDTIVEPPHEELSNTEKPVDLSSELNSDLNPEATQPLDVFSPDKPETKVSFGIYNVDNKANEKHFGLRVDAEILRKFKVCASHTGRSVNSMLIQLMVRQIVAYETEYGEIRFDD